MKVKLLSYTAQAEVLCATAARTCYSSDAPSKILESIDEAKADKFIDNVVGMGHHSIIEHAHYTFSLEGVSRAMTHQLVGIGWHRFAAVPALCFAADAGLCRPNHGQRKTGGGSRSRKQWNRPGAPTRSWPRSYRWRMPGMCSRTRAPANIMVTMNARELLHFFTIRCCSRAQWEIREVANLMLEEVLKVSPSIFKDAGPGCVRGPCPEGKLSCGRPRKRR